MFKQTKIRIEKRQISIIRKDTVVRYEVCPHCNETTQMFTVGQTAIVLRISERDVFRLVETDALDFFETTGGRLFICAASVNKFVSEITPK